MKKSKKLHRDDETAIVAGVLSGMAYYFAQDPLLFRLFAVFFIILTGVFPGVIMYLIAWLVMPKGKQADYTIDQ